MINSEEISFDDFAKVKIMIGTIVDAKPNEKAIKPAYILTVDFGDYGIKTSSAQITENYDCDNLLGKQIVAVMNFPSKRIAGVKSEVLVLAGVNDKSGTVLLTTTHTVPNGTQVS